MDYLVHHGIKGMKWGVRRYQNPDGTLTAEGKKRLHHLGNTINSHQTKTKIDKSVKIVDSMKESAKKSGLLDDNDNLTSSGKSFMDRMVQMSYYTSLPLQKTAMAMAQPTISKWSDDVRTEYLDAYNRSLEYSKRGRAAEASVWGARANAIATRQQLQSFYGANVDEILETKYEDLH